MRLGFAALCLLFITGVLSSPAVPQTAHRPFRKRDSLLPNPLIAARQVKADHLRSLGNGKTDHIRSLANRQISCPYPQPSGGCCPSGSHLCTGLYGTGCYTDYQTDPNNCGFCLNACSDTQVCVDGTCTSCADVTGNPNALQCNGVCDTTKCGSCDYECGENQYCENSNGVYSCLCEANLVYCEGLCLPASYSDCSTSCRGPCDDASICVDGTCTSCKTDVWPYQISCNGECVITGNSNCGACGYACPGATQCYVRSGDGPGGYVYTCSCPSDDERSCGDQCVSIFDTNNCGACGTVCPPGAPCDGLSCCTDTQQMCGGICTDITENVNDCGSCGNVCSDTDYCFGGECFPCSASEIQCSNVCVVPSSDADNCGGCGIQCGTDSSGYTIGCIEGICCDLASGLNVCGGACVSTESNPKACGPSCTVCNSDEICSNGVCQTCGAGELLCSGECIDPLTNPVNCGKCGYDCVSVDAPCVDGICCVSELYHQVNGRCVPNYCNTGSDCRYIDMYCSSSHTCVECPGNDFDPGDGYYSVLSCDNSCVSAATNENCGECGHSCTGGLVCSNWPLTLGVPYTGTGATFGSVFCCYEASTYSVYDCIAP